jgi:hypothetical protein
MKTGRIRIEKMTLRMRGVRPRQGEQMAGVIARDIANTLAAPGTLEPGQTEIPSLSLRLRVKGGGSRPRE